MLKLEYKKFFLLIICLSVINCKDKSEYSLTENSSIIPVFNHIPDENSPKEELHNYASMQWERGNYQQALNFFTIAYKKANLENDHKLKAKLLNNIGLTYWKLGDNKIALESYQESASLAEKYNLKTLLALTYTNQALIFREEEAYKTAKSLNMKAIEILLIDGNSRDLAISYNNHGQIFKQQSKMDSAKIYYHRALSIYDTIDYPDGMSATYGNLAEVYSHQNLKDKAVFSARKALDLGLKSKSAVRISEGYKRLSDVFRNFSMIDSAFFYHQKYAEFQEEQFKKNSENKLAEYQTHLAYELKNLKIENLEKEQKLAQNKMWMILGAILILSLVLILLLYKKSVTAQMKKKELEKHLEHSQNIINVKQEELKSYIIDLADKSNKVNELQEELSKLTNSNATKIAELMNSKILTDEDWGKFKAKFNVIYPHLIVKIRQLKTNITEAETRYLVLHHLSLSPKEMANVLGISTASIHTCKMRLKRKLQDENYDSVEAFLS